MDLQSQLAELPEERVRHLVKRGFRPERLLAWAEAMKTPRDVRNRLRGVVEPPAEGELLTRRLQLR